MDINYAFLCDYATTSKDGKLSILGIFANINVAGLPGVHPQAFLAFELGLHYTELNEEHQLRIECRDADGNQLFEIDGPLTVEGKAGPRDEPPRVTQAMRLQMLRFERAGSYDINFNINGEHKRTVTFTVTDTSEEEPPEITAEGPPELGS